MADSWSKADLGSVATWSSGGTPAKSRNEYWNGGVPWVSPKDMKRFSLEDTEDHISARAVDDGARIVPAGTVFIVVRGMILAHTFPVCIAQRSMSFNQDVKALIPRLGVEGRFLAHWLHGKSNALLGLVTEATHGTKRLDLRDLQATEILLPPSSEQQRIAEILDTVDVAIRKTEQLIAKLKQVKQGLLHDLLTRGIDDNGELRDPTRHPEQFKDSPLGRTPKTWGLSNLGDLTEVFNGSTPPRAVPSYWGGTIPWLSSGKVNDYIVRAASKWITPHAMSATHLRLVPRGAVVVGLIGQGKTRGMSARLEIDATINQNLAAVIPGPRLRGTYLHFYLSYRYEALRSGGRGSNQDALNCELLRSFPVPLPPIDEQSAIEGVLCGLESRLASESTDVEKTSLLKQGLMEDLLTGRVRVTNLLGEAAA
jgi:type I restriction enzyme S subunit